MRYIIKKGKHFAKWSWNRLWPFAKIPKQFMVKFGDECWYDNSLVENPGYNKLCGFSGLNIHYNSARVVWQPDFDSPGYIKLYGYVYDRGGNWKAEYIMTVKTEEAFNIFIGYSNGKWVFIVTSYNGGKTIEMSGHKPIIKLKAYPYFGGKDTAYHDMTINIK